MATAIWSLTAARSTLRRLLLALAGAAVVMTVSMSAAVAAGNDGSDAAGAMSWIDLEDSRGFSIWQYNLNIHQGSVTSFWKALFAYPLTWMWGAYRLAVAVVTWFFQFILEFSWLRVLIAPINALNEGVEGVVDTLGLAPALLVVAGGVSAVWIIRGRWALGVSELLISLVVASAATGILARPLDLVTGADGLIYQARDFGLSVAAELAQPDDGSATAPDDLPEAVSAMLVDTFVRQPHQLVNYGESFDGTPCEDAYDAAVAISTPYSSSDQPRRTVGECSPPAFDHADNPDFAQIGTMSALGPSTAFIMVLIVVFGAVTVGATLNALWQGVKLSISLVTSILPGRGRGMLWQNIADLAIALTVLIFAVSFIAGFMVFLQAVFGNTGELGWNLIATMLFVDLLLIVGVVALIRGKKAIRRAADRLAAAMATRPSGKPTALPERSQMKSELVGAAKLATGIYTVRQLRNRAFKHSHDGSDTHPGGQPRPGSPPTPPGPSQPRPAGPNGPSDTSVTLTRIQPSTGSTRRELQSITRGKTVPAIAAGAGPAGRFAMPESPGQKHPTMPVAAATTLLTGGTTSAILTGARALGRSTRVARNATRTLTMRGAQRRANVIARMAGLAALPIGEAAPLPLPPSTPSRAKPADQRAAPQPEPPAPKYVVQRVNGQKVYTLRPPTDGQG